MRQTLIKAQWAQAVDIYPEQVRDALAEALDGQNMSLLFNYEPDGSTRKASPVARFIGGKRWQGLLVLEGYEPLAGQAMMPYVQTLARMSGSPPQIHIEEHDTSLDFWPDSPVAYRLSKMAIRDRKGRIERFDKAVVERAILRGLRETLSLYGVSGIDAEDLFAGYLEEKQVPYSRGKTVLTSGTLLLNGNLKGIWQIGAFQSLGHGRISRIIN